MRGSERGKGSQFQMLPMLYHQCISEQVRKFGLEFLDGKGTLNLQHIVIEALFLGMKWLTAISNVWDFFFETVSCGPGWLQTCSVPQDGLEFLILLPSSSKCWD